MSIGHVINALLANLDPQQQETFRHQREQHHEALRRLHGRNILPEALQQGEAELLAQLTTGRQGLLTDPVATAEVIQEARIAERLNLKRANHEADRRHAAEQNSVVARTYVDGASFVYDIPDTIPALWGRDQDVLWAKGEALMICGSSGVGKTTLAGQVVRALVLGGDLLGLPIRPQGRVLYLAMDRPEQIARSLHRQFRPAPGVGDVKAALERSEVAKNLVVWKGPPPADFAKNPEVLTSMCVDARADVVVIDSLKDAAIGLSEDAVGAGYNSARQLALANGIQVLELHHQVKRGANGEAPTSLADVFGSTWLTGGAGSVILLAGTAGDPIVEFRHLKQPAEPVGPFKVIHDHANGSSAVWHKADAVELAKAAGSKGVTATEFATVLFDKGSKAPTESEKEKARRRLNALVRSGQLVKVERAQMPGMGGAAPAAYVLPGSEHHTIEGSHCRSCGEMLHPALQSTGIHPNCDEPEDEPTEPESTHASTHAPLFDVATHATG